MRANTETLLSLFEWGQLLGLDPFELGQWQSPVTMDRQCNSVFYQFQWQQDYLSREEVASAIEKAESAIASQLGYWPAPRYVEQTIERPSLFVGRRVGALPLTLDTAYFRGGGILARTLLDAGAAVAYSDPDGDDVNETFTVTLATTITDPDEIVLYTSAADRHNAPIDETWRIRPVRVVIAAGTATITGHATLMVVPDLTTGVDAEALDAANPATYVTTVDVYRLYRDVTATVDTPNQGLALWRSPPDCGYGPPCTATTRPVCLAEQPTPNPNAYAGTTAAVDCGDWRSPDSLTVRYLAGKPREVGTGRMSRDMADIVAHLATAWLPVDKCGCERSSRIIHWWRSLPTEGEENEKGGRPVTFDEISAPFGERRGAMWAWNRVKELRSVGAFSL